MKNSKKLEGKKKDSAYQLHRHVGHSTFKRQVRACGGHVSAAGCTQSSGKLTGMEIRLKGGVGSGVMPEFLASMIQSSSFVHVQCCQTPRQPCVPWNSMLQRSPHSTNRSQISKGLQGTTTLSRQAGQEILSVLKFTRS